MTIRAVLDTNVVVSSLLSRYGPSHDIAVGVRSRRFQLIMSASLRTEYESALGRSSIARRIQLTAVEVAAFLDAIQDRSEVVVPSDQIPVRIRDAHDDHVLGTALAGSANYLVTGDLDLMTLDGNVALGRLRIVNPRHFLSILDMIGNGTSL